MPVAWKAAFALPAALSLVSANPPLDAPTVGINDARVVKVTCFTSSGTAFQVGKDYFLTVKHVTRALGCSVDGEPIRDVWEDPARDFAIFRIDARKPKSLKIDCGGFIPGRKYRAIGHARGLTEQTAVTLVATGETNGGFAVLRGIFTVIPGMSGGVFQDAITGKAVGTVNVYVPHMGLSGSIPLSETSVCADA